MTSEIFLLKNCTEIVHTSSYELLQNAEDALTLRYQKDPGVDFSG